MSEPLVRSYVHDGWLEISLNRPKRRNALIGPLVDELFAAFDAADRDDAVHVVLLRGEGGAFCSGLDLKEFAADPPPDWMPAFSGAWRGLHERIFRSRTPLVGALERCAINGGAALALACDLLVAGDEAFLQVGEVQGGMAAPMNVAWLRLRHPESVAMNVALTGRRIAGPELVRLGVALSSVPDETVADRARELAAQLAGYPEGALARIKGAIRGYAPEDAAAWFDRASASDPLRGFTPQVPPTRVQA
ncbi:MAG: enoyl-CoA hydratase/isomerase family protein [Deltaproteobacteria bacterium]|nr:enoyl-CoA hydratase/isomerase family protein [Deltaproteobacteria bacterium]MBW2416033.1 enoyl-CoA hydratase/isomerase family protein [Deltaproteobacteria bacterium]